ncbi:type 1 glutamine amidotransferase [Bdellovibrio sp. ZAP7]|uniref:type 1 glutamine amidotransferase n=1 Tax=Bdellovibrio sp. ZAP7 TaxID=2231053 RepID=UPI00115993BB|nr:type 1 glutamine amidotransferase [Bdellovibrio sp. ZAP7]QDK46972.1 type 1 glutamine amidotransferase [Bdellovibrio sp. ZAP7]
MKKLLIIQHELDGPPGTTLDWASQNNYAVELWSPYLGEPAPTRLDYDGAVICGGSMDTFEEEKFPWLRAEKKLIRDLIDNNVKIFGLCLGSQLIADIMGGKVHIHDPGWEIGFVPVETTDGETIQAFHWHHCTFDLPPGAELFATNSFCKNQGYKIGKNIVATQFHPETTEDWIRECADEVGTSHKGIVQNRTEMLASLPLQKPLKEWYFRQLDKLFNS